MGGDSGRSSPLVLPAFMGAVGQDVYILLSYDSSASELVSALSSGMPNNSFRGFVHTYQTTRSFLIP